VAKELGVKSGIIYLPGQEEKFYEDSDMGPEFRQRRQYVARIPENMGYLANSVSASITWLALISRGAP
jgi:hypothetical protein